MLCEVASRYSCTNLYCYAIVVALLLLYDSLD